MVFQNSLLSLLTGFYMRASLEFNGSKLSKYANNETMEKTISFGIYKSMYHDSSYLLLFEKR